MEKISSRKNKIITHMRRLSAEPDYRRECGLFVCEGEKMLREALASGAKLRQMLWGEGAEPVRLPEIVEQYSAPAELVEYAAPLKTCRGPVFTVSMPERLVPRIVRNALVIENLQDPGNVGTIIRTAAAFDIDAVIVVGACADVYSPKTVRATMGAIFRQRVLKTELGELRDLLSNAGLPLYGAALSEDAEDIRGRSLKGCAVAVGSEGRGLSEELLGLCAGKIIIPMNKSSESLNAAVAAALIMWEMSR